MIPELGQFCIILAMLLAITQAVLGIAGAQKNIPRWIHAARPVARGQAGFVIIAFVALAWCFLYNDFSVLYVVKNSNANLPWYFRLTAVWGGHQGSLLLWVTILGIWTIAVSILSRQLPDDMTARVLGVMGLISFGFLSYMFFTSNPFRRQLPPATHGMDLNPLLQAPGMISHPPMLYMGYVGFSVAFAFAIAALLSGRLDAAWARWTRPWTTAAWAFLTLGIMLGSWWSYTELGWGGWWFWDPVENASFMPWLAGLALIHSLAVTEKRGAFRSWTVLLAIIAFSLSLLGTFLVRSGVLTSVHAFAVSPTRGIYILAFLAIVIGGSFALYVWRAPKVGLGGRFSSVSRESMLLIHNIVFLVACGAVLLGTLYPLFVDVLGFGKITVGEPFFNTVFAPLVAPSLFLIGVGPIARWKKADVPTLARQLKWAFGIAVVTGLIAPVLMGRFSWVVALGILAATWIAAATVTGLIQRIRQMGWRKLRLPRAYIGMLFAHLGVAVFIVGVTFALGYTVQKDVRMTPGDQVAIAGYTLTFMGTEPITGPTYTGRQGVFILASDGERIDKLKPETRLYNVSGRRTTEAAINYGITGDVYASLGDALGGGAWVVRVYHKAFVEWIWAGCFLMAIGGFTALSDRRYRVRAAARLSRKGRREQPLQPENKTV